MLNIGDYVIYKRDVCKIDSIKILNNNDYYVLKPIDDEILATLVPKDNRFGYLRNIINKNYLS